MIKLLSRKKLNPSQLAFTGETSVEPIEAQQYDYSLESFGENHDVNLATVTGFPQDQQVHWLNIHGIHDPELITKLSNELKIHTLAIQDILDVKQRPKFQEFDQYWFFTLKSVMPTETETVQLEQMSFILGDNYLVSFQERKADYFSHIRSRIKNNVGIVRSKGPDFLLYLMLEAILDNYFQTIHEIENKTQAIDIFNSQTDLSPEFLKDIEKYKLKVHTIKKTIVPIRDFISSFERESFGRIQAANVKYFYEIKDLCLSLMDDCESIELSLESQANLFFSVQGHLMNQVMKTLTIVATIFIPITFVAGVYGMNFNSIPELSWRHGYLYFWAIVVSMLALMIYYFKKKKWF